MKKSLKKKTRSKRVVVRNRTKRVYNNRLKVGGMDAGDDDENRRGKKTPRHNEQPRLVRLHHDELKKPDSKRRKKYEPPPLAGQKRAPDDEEQASKRPKTTERAFKDAVEQANFAQVDAEVAHIDAEVARVDAEGARAEAEVARADAEGARAEAEAARAEVEAARADAEIESFICPITNEIMVDPVICSDGHSYERAAIERWFNRGNNSSPTTNEQLPNINLIPNHNLRQAIAEWSQQQ